MKTLKKYGWSLWLSAVLAAELVLLGDGAAVFFGGSTPPVLACGLWLLLTILSGFLLRWNRRRLASLACGIPLALAILAGTCFVCWGSFSHGADYEFPDAGKNQMFGDRKVMVLVPHQDDELNILGGVLEEYARYGSQLYPVFVTNGDYVGLTQTRYQEALAVFRQMDVPEEQVIFLGYGNEWQAGGPHLYNAPAGMVLESHIGRTATYGTASHPAWREGRDYTIDNLTEDLKDVILSVRPDVIFCTDYDSNIDHKALTLLFEKAMGQLLKENPDYTPVVYKAYAYSTAWEAEADYYADHVLSTKDPFAASFGQKPAVYRWEDRVRFPVQGDLLSRSLTASRGYDTLKQYRSQGAQLKGASVLNGDKVAWQRHTDSLCLRAAMEVSSGEGRYLHDFMLVENNDLLDESRMPFDGVWTPTDEEKTAAVTLEKPTDLAVLALYDHPDPEQNVLNAVITFDDGTRLETGPLDPNGAATWVAADKTEVSSFSVKLVQTEGERAGLSEVEAFARMPQPDGRFLKLTDGDGNFLYDCLTAPDGTMELSLYIHGGLPEWNGGNYFINTSGAGTAAAEDGVIRVTCPVGEKFILHVACNEEGVSDNIVIRNPGPLRRFWDGLWQRAEEMVFSRYSAQRGKDLLIPATWTKISHVLRHL